ncbi:MAG: carboxypeptidase-like regulatory domain-containing protein [Chloroflexota bacterium]
MSTITIHAKHVLRMGSILVCLVIAILGILILPTASTLAQLPPTPTPANIPPTAVPQPIPLPDASISMPVGDVPDGPQCGGEVSDTTSGDDTGDDDGDDTATGATALGTVLDADGTPIANAFITVHRDDHAIYCNALVTGENGQFQVVGLTAGSWLATIFYPSSVVQLDPIAFRVSEDAAGNGGSIDLGSVQFTEPPKTIVGTVRNQATGEGAANVTVHAMKVTNEPWHSPAMIETETDANGSYTLKVTGGTWVVAAYPSNSLGIFSPFETPSTTQQIQFADDTTEETQSLDFAISLPDAQITGRIVSPDGSPLMPLPLETADQPLLFPIMPSSDPDEFSMGVMVIVHGTTPDSFYPTMVDASGFFTISLYADSYSLSVTMDPTRYPGLFSPSSQRITIGEAETLNLGDIALVAGTKIIQGVVQSDAGAGVADVQIYAHQMSSEPFSIGGVASTQTDASGTFSLTVTGGAWGLNISPIHDPEDPFATSPWFTNNSGQTVLFSNDTAAETQDVVFMVQFPDATLQGRLVAPDGSALSFNTASPSPEPFPDYYDSPPYDSPPSTVSVFSFNGYSNHTTIEADGTFSLPVVAGRYEINIYIDNEQFPAYYVPVMTPQSVTSNETLDLGDIRLGEKTAQISGQVLDPNGAGIPFVSINAWSRNGEWLDVTTDETGSYSLLVQGGTWEIRVNQYDYGFPPGIETGPDTGAETETAPYFFTDPSTQVSIADNGTATVNFQAVGVAGQILGQVTDADGELLTDLYQTWVYARRVGDSSTVTQKSADNSVNGPVDNLDDTQGGYPIYGGYNHYQITTQALVENGRFTMPLPSGVYEIGIHLPYNSEYIFSSEENASIQADARTSNADKLANKTLAWAEAVSQAKTRAEVALLKVAVDSEQRVTILPNEYPNSAEADASVTLVLHRKDATITGTLQDADGAAITDVYGHVYAWIEGPGETWQSVNINPETGTYALPVSAGTWQVSYYLETTEYVGHGHNQTSVEVDAQATVVHDIVAPRLDAVIQGQLLDVDGNPVTYGHAWAASVTAEENANPSVPPVPTFYQHGEVINGEFVIPVLSGQAYEIGANSGIYDNGPDSDIIQPRTQTVTPTSASTVAVTLQMRTADVTINGTVTVPSTVPSEAADIATNAYVYGWSPDGQHVYANSDADGNFSLKAASGSVLFLNAMWQPPGSQSYYSLQDEVEVSLENITPDTILDSVILALQLDVRSLPPAAASTFSADQAWTETLADGTSVEIPAGAIPASREGGELSITITPLVQDLPGTMIAQPVGYGYAIHVYDLETGTQIEEEFNADVTLTFYYTDDELAEAGITEDEIAPAYFATSTNSWVVLDSFSVDAEANQIKAQVRHFSRWALVASAVPVNAGPPAALLNPTTDIPVDVPVDAPVGVPDDSAVQEPTQPQAPEQLPGQTGEQPYRVFLPITIQ